MKAKLKAFAFLTFPIGVLLFSVFGLNAQSNYIPLNHQLNELNFATLPADSQNYASSFHPLIFSEKFPEEGEYFRSYQPVDRADSSFLLRKKYKDRSWIHRKLLKENFIIIDTGILYLTIDPLLNLSAGQENYHHTSEFTFEPEGDIGPGQNVNQTFSLYNNTRGLLLKGDIGSKLSFETYFYENQARLPSHVSTFVNHYQAVPGQGRVKLFEEEAFDYAYSGGYFSYRPWKFLQVQAGHHRHFIGNGYRSLILSDNSFNYPFAKFDLSFWKERIQYSVLYASIFDLERINVDTQTEKPFRRKGATFHTVDVNFSQNFQWSLYQGMVWQTQSNDGTDLIDYNMFSPLIYWGPIAVAPEDEHQTVIGTGFKFDVTPKTRLYGQFVVNMFEDNQNAKQLGVLQKFGKRLVSRLEWNQVRPYMYSAFNGRESYAHNNVALAHPLGNAFSEWVLRVHYRKGRWLASVQLNYAEFEDELQEIVYGVNDFIDLPYVFLLRQNRKIFYSGTLELAYVLNPATNLKLFTNFSVRYDSRYGSTEEVYDSKFFYFGLRTDLRNIYYDF